MTRSQADAEDLTQETFIRVHRSLATFRGEASVGTWLYRIATNVSFDYFRRNTTRQARTSLSFEETDLDSKWGMDEITSSPEQLAAQSEMSGCLAAF